MTTKKAYEPPKLTVHGDVVELTRVKGGTHGDDHGKPNTFLTGTKT